VIRKCLESLAPFGIPEKARLSKVKKLATRDTFSVGVKVKVSRD
jgi:hypothetical protein